jgi:hypothetical protein
VKRRIDTTTNRLLAIRQNRFIWIILATRTLDNPLVASRHLSGLGRSHTVLGWHGAETPCRTPPGVGQPHPLPAEAVT